MVHHRLIKGKLFPRIIFFFIPLFILLLALIFLRWQTDKTKNWVKYYRNDFGYEVKLPKGTRISDIPAGFDNRISGTYFNFTNSAIRINYGIKQRNFTNINSYLEYWQDNTLPNENSYSKIKLQTGLWAIYKYDILPNGEKYGIILGTFGKNFEYSIGFGNMYDTSLFTPEDEQKFWEFVNTFKLLPENSF